MFGTEFLLGNTAAISGLTITFFMVLFYAMGRILQNKFKFTQSYKALAVPLGFITYELITFLLYSTFIIFTNDYNTFYWLEITKVITLSILVLAMFRDWVPTIKDFNKKNIISFTYLVSVIVGIFILSYWSIQTIDYMKINPVSPMENLSWQKEFQTFNINAFVMADITSLSFTDNLLIIRNFLNIATITLLFAGIAKYRKELTTYALIPVAGISIIYINGLLENQFTLFMTLIIFSTTMFYLYANSKHKNRLFLYSIILSSTLFMTFSNIGIIYSIIFSAPALYLSQKDNSGAVYVLNTLLISLALQITLLSYASNPFIGLISLIFSLFIIVPLNISIVNRKSTSIIEIDKILVESRRTIAIIGISALFIVSAIVSLTNKEFFASNINNWYTNYLFSTGNLALDQSLTYSLYLLMISLPLITYVYKDSNTKFTKYIVMMSVILLNPITIGAFNNLFGSNLEFNNLLILLSIPTGLTLIDVLNIYLIPQFKRV